MGCGVAYLKWLCEKNYLKAYDNVFDIGEQCLLANRDDEQNRSDFRYIFDKLSGDNEREREREREREIADYSWRSTLRGHPTTPTLLLGDVLTKTSVKYVAIDICRLKYAELFDLNIHHLEKKFHNYFNIVLNYGTTEHILNQYNCFKIMHDACMPGGYMLSQIPASGYVNHGYFNYDPLLFADLAKANNYNLISIWFNRAGGDECIMDINEQIFPSMLDKDLLNNNPDHFRKTSSPVLNLNIIMQKTSENEFSVIPEVRTAATNMHSNQEYTSRYIEKENPLNSRFSKSSLQNIISRVRKIFS